VEYNMTDEELLKILKDERTVTSRMCDHPDFKGKAIEIIMRLAQMNDEDHHEKYINRLIRHYEEKLKEKEVV
jgi:hypothetical protein